MKAETVYQHSVTDAELLDQFGFAWTEEEYRELMVGDTDTMYGAIVRLYRKRGDEKMQQKYLRKIKDRFYRQGVLTHCLTP